jgi:hypothetical protein
MISLSNFKNKFFKKTSLSIWDIDDTLFLTKANVYVKKDGKIVKKLTNKQYNTYELQDGETFDYTEFHDSKYFNSTSEPIIKSIKRLISLHNKIKSSNSKIIIITARSDFDDKDVFLNTFRKYKIDIDQIHVHRAGNLKTTGSAGGKKVFIKKYLDTKKYGIVRLFDDDVSNLKMFNGLKKEYPETTFQAYLAHADGSITKY